MSLLKKIFILIFTCIGTVAQLEPVPHVTALIAYANVQRLALSQLSKDTKLNNEWHSDQNTSCSQWHNKIIIELNSKHHMPVASLKTVLTWV